MTRIRAAILLSLGAAAAGACGRQDATPTAVENGQMDNASNLLDAAPEELELVNERLPDSNAAERPAGASGT